MGIPVIHSQIWSCLVEAGTAFLIIINQLLNIQVFQIFLFIINHTVILIRYIFRHIHSNFSRRQSQKANSGSKNVLLHTAFFSSQRLIYTHINDVWDDKNSALLHHHWIVFSLKYCNVTEKVYLYCLLTNKVMLFPSGIS